MPTVTGKTPQGWEERDGEEAQRSRAWEEWGVMGQGGAQIGSREKMGSMEVFAESSFFRHHIQLLVFLYL